jgi:hypothetical protein
MRFRWMTGLAWCAVLLAAPYGKAAPGAVGALWDAAARASGPAAAARAEQFQAARDVQELAARIDRALAARWAAAGVEPAPRADDATFLRRAYLDLAGRIPSVAEARAFLKDQAPEKRRRLVERLLGGNAYANHFTNVWRTLLLPEADASFQFGVQKPVFELWLRKQFAENRGYDQVVRELLTVPFGDGQGGYSQPYNGENRPTATSFYYAKDIKPESLGASTARLFLGVKLDCAQCHDHPFAKWTRQQFWEYAAFFGGFDVESRMGFIQSVREVKDRRELTISGGNKVVQAAFLDGSEPQWKYNLGSREALAEWMTSPKNPWFARAAANRLWAYFFGTGLVEPVDDLRDDNPASHPELLDELARQFAAHQFDFKFLIRAITASRAYQMSSKGAGKDDPRLFARMALRGLSPEQLYDSMATATGFREKGPNRRFFFLDTSVRADFMKQFANTDKRTEFQTSILQSLLLMNGKLTEEVTSPQRSATLAAVADSPFLGPEEKVETLFLAALARPPRSDERERYGRYVRTGGVRGDARAALGDVFWVLLNGPEFLLNH